MTIQLNDYLGQLARKKCVWGQSDCLMILADWVQAVHGVDPAADYRGRYSSEQECRAILIESRGLLRLVRTTMARLGFHETKYPITGDIAVVRAPCRRGERLVLRDTGALVVDKFFALLTPDAGLVMSHQVKMRAAWRTSWPRQ